MSGPSPDRSLANLFDKRRVGLCQFADMARHGPEVLIEAACKFGRTCLGFGEQDEDAALQRVRQSFQQLGIATCVVLPRPSLRGFHRPSPESKFRALKITSPTKQ